MTPTQSQSQSQSECGSSTYTTIPISPPDVISRSFQNLWAATSRRRPWPELVASSALERPHSLSDAVHRIQRNAKRFGVNYGLFVCGCGAISLIGTPLSLIVAAAVLALWLLLYLFREDPLVLWGHQLGDRALLLLLLLLSIAALCLSNMAPNLLVGAGLGMALCGLHALLLNPDAFFLDEEEAASANLVHPPPHVLES